jgi:hypothetical protein
MQTLTVINDMLGTMGEAPLASLEEPHTFRGACLSTLDGLNASIQSRGWWFNLEKLTLSANVDGLLYLPGDAINVRSPERRLVKRGRRIYDLDKGAFATDATLDVVIVRQLAFEDLPESAATYIATSAVHRFQSRYDGDVAKTRELAEAVRQATIAVNTENIRERKINLIESNDKLMRMKMRTGRQRLSGY